MMANNTSELGDDILVAFAKRAKASRLFLGIWGS